MNIRTKISLWYAGLLILIIVLFSVAVFGVIQATIINSIDSGLAQTSSNIRQNIRVIPMGEFGALETGVVFRNSDIFNVPGLSIQVWQTSDSETRIEPILIQSSSDLRDVEHALDSSALNATSPTFNKVILNNIPERVMTQPFITTDGQQLGVIQIASSLHIVDQVTTGLIKVMLVVTIIGVVISIVLGMMLSYRALQPIQEITAAAARISTTDDLTTRLPENVPDDEIGHLTRVFNHMMARLEHLFGVQQRFVTDLSHELRTPLTAIQGNLDMINRYGLDDDSLQVMQHATSRMTRMVNEVLMLARADYGDVTIDLYPLDLDEIVMETVSIAPSHAHNKGRNLTFKLAQQESVQINGNFERLQQVVHNLISNACKFTPDGGTITLSVYQCDDSGILEVTDTGIGIAKENLTRIFDRFYQIDDSRAHFNDDDGAGLGLAIVKWIVDAHRGEIEVESQVDVGTTFRVKFPLLKENTYSQKSKVLSAEY